MAPGILVTVDIVPSGRILKDYSIACDSVYVIQSIQSNTMSVLKIVQVNSLSRDDYFGRG